MSKLRRRGAGGWLASRSAKQTVAKDGDETLEAKQGSRQQKGNLRKKTEKAARIERLKATNKKNIGIEGEAVRGSANRER